jgi:phosphatidate cytidylyltransferase
LAILITASSVGSILALKYGSQNPTISNLNARINAWWVMTLVLVLAFVTGHIGSTFLFFLVSFAALRECLSLVYSRRGDYAVLVACFYVVLPVQYYFVLTDWYGMFAIFIPVYAFLLLPILAGLSGDPTRFLDRTAKIQWSLMVSVFCISHVPFLLNLKIPNFDQNILLVIFLIAVVQASDVLQYIWGKLLGKRKIAPVLSPSKTVEGFVGGVLSATALATALWWITPFTPFQAGLIGLVICLMGFAGGLVMSAIKRDFGVKDWGHMIKGHGGMMDRVDSICFAAPIFFHIVRYFWS